MSNMIVVLPLMTSLGIEVPRVAHLFRWNGDLTSAPEWLVSALKKGEDRGIVVKDDVLHVFNGEDDFLVQIGEFVGVLDDPFAHEPRFTVTNDETIAAKGWDRKTYDGRTYFFEDPPGQRFNRYGVGVSRCDPNGSWWWIEEHRRWAEFDEMKAIGLGGGSSARCKTFKALRRHVREHWKPGVEFLWASRFGGRVIVV